MAMFIAHAPPMKKAGRDLLLAVIGFGLATIVFGLSKNFWLSLAMLYLTGVRAVNPKYEVLGDPAVSLDDIKQFRQINSKTPGHPEYRLTSGVETTTGPLGQGVGNSVGMAIAGEWLAARYNRPGFELFNYNVYAVCGDGDLMEGVASEAASLAGHLKLPNLCWIYDNNKVTLDGPAVWSFSEDVPKRFEAYGWRVEHVTDANDTAALARSEDGHEYAGGDARRAR